MAALRALMEDDHGLVVGAENGDVSSVTDSSIKGKYRLFSGTGSGAVYGGVKLPTGRSDVTATEDGRLVQLEPSVQPRSGAFDAQLGAAYSRDVGRRARIDVSGDYRLRFTVDGYKLGDQALGGVALLYRSTTRSPPASRRSAR